MGTRKPADHANGPKRPSANLRYAHPFFAKDKASTDRQAAHANTNTSEAFSRANLGPIPKPSRDPEMTLEEIVGTAGVAEIEAAGAIRFHCVGDTGQPNGRSQELVAEGMAADFHPEGKGSNPAFLFHLGDVIYGHSKDALFRDEFYRPYHNYPGKIIAIPGNHDGETFPTTDPESLKAFRDNFCAEKAAVPPIAAGIGVFRETMTQPGVYWMLDTPFAQIIGLYSNLAENPGFLDGANNDQSQKEWLQAALTKVKAQRKDTRKALLLATHHPPFSSAGHSGSTQMLADIDTICKKAGIMPDAFLSGHAHNYQRYTRRMGFNGNSMEIPFIVAGTGGHGLQAVPEASGQLTGDTVYEKSLKADGFLLITASRSALRIEFWDVQSNSNSAFDVVTVNLATNHIS